MALKCYNRIDDQGRFIENFYRIEKEPGQVETHTYSYIYSRKLYKQILKVDKMGLELKMEEKNE